MLILDLLNNCGAVRKRHSILASSSECGRVCRQSFRTSIDQAAKWCFLLSLCAVTACSKPETHVAKIDLVNDLGTQAQVALCKDVLHCEAISDLWTPKQIDAKDVESVVVSNEEMTVFKVTTEQNGKPDVRCLRVRIDRSSKGEHNLLLSSATGC
jgi:hypothetical protein